MVFPRSLGLGIRHVAISRSSTFVTLRLCQSDLRSFSSVLQPPCSTRGRAFKALGSRSFFWRSSPTPSEPLPPVPPEPPAPPLDSEVVDTSTEADTTSLLDGTPEGVDAEVVEVSTGVDAFDTPAVVDVESIPSDLTETLISNVPAALQYGDLAALGLAGWSPAGIVRWSMELINVSTGMPWFWTIVAGSALWRLFCVPFAIRGFQASARLMPLQPQIMELQKAITKSKSSQNPLELQRAAQAMSRFYKTHNVNPLAGLVSMVQLPVTFGLFFGIQKMCNLPLEQLTYSGVPFIPDLTVADPTMILPLAMFVLVNAQLRLSIRDINTTEQPNMAHLMNIFRIVTVPGIYIMNSLPSGLLISLLTTTLLTMLQTVLLRIPAVRLALKIPIVPVELQGKLPRFRDTFQRIKEYFLSQGDLKGRVEKARREAMAKERMNRPRRW